jgi:hypothetical protein
LAGIGKVEEKGPTVNVNINTQVFNMSTFVELILSPHSFEDIFSLVPPLFKATDKTFFIDHSSFYFFCGSSFWVGKFLEELMLFPLTNSSPIRTRRGIVMIVP